MALSKVCASVMALFTTLVGVKSRGICFFLRLRFWAVSMVVLCVMCYECGQFPVFWYFFRFAGV